MKIENLTNLSRTIMVGEFGWVFHHRHPVYNVNILSGPRVFQPLLVDPTQVESKKSSQIQWPVPSINAEPVDIFLGEE